MELKYGINPNQKSARVYSERELPFKALNGRPGYINLLDALHSWQLVRELARANGGAAAAASFKHVSPAGAAVVAASSTQSAQADAYRTARNVDPGASYGDWAALSGACDLETALVLRPLVSDGVIAPAFTPDALEILSKKKRGAYCVLQIDPEYEPPDLERREVFGVTFEQQRNNIVLSTELLGNVVTANKNIPEQAKRDLVIALITLKYTQSNSVVYAYDGAAIGVGAGQQSRIACTRLAGDKAQNWLERNNASGAPLALASDAFFPFVDNIEEAAARGVKYIAQPGGSVRDSEIIEACNKFGIAMCFTGIRLFLH